MCFPSMMHGLMRHMTSVSWRKIPNKINMLLYIDIRTHVKPCFVSVCNVSISNHKWHTVECGTAFQSIIYEHESIIIYLHIVIVTMHINIEENGIFYCCLLFECCISMIFLSRQTDRAIKAWFWLLYHITFADLVFILFLRSSMSTS